MKIDQNAKPGSNFIEGPAIIETDKGIRYVYSVLLAYEYVLGRGFVKMLTVSADDRVFEYLVDRKLAINEEESVVEFSSRGTQYKIRELRDDDKERMFNVQNLPPAEEKSQVDNEKRS